MIAEQTREEEVGQDVKSTAKVHPYLFFNGQCKEAFEFYAQCLGGKIEAMLTPEGTPMAQETPPELHQSIMHACMSVGGLVLQGSDCPPDYYEEPKGFCVQLSVETSAEAERIFHTLAENGKVTMPLEQTFWAARFGMLVDQFGIPWMVNCSEDCTQAE